jgi:hypothetical protein
MVKEPKVIIGTFTDDEAVRMLKQWDFKSYSIRGIRLWLPHYSRQVCLNLIVIE